MPHTELEAPERLRPASPPTEGQPARDRLPSPTLAATALAASALNAPADTATTVAAAADTGAPVPRMNALSADTAGGSSGPLGASRAYPMPASNADASRFLLQAQLSASDAEIVSVRVLGYAGWLGQQLSAPLGPTGWDWLNGRGYAAIDNATRFYDATYPADYMLWNQLMTGPDGVRKRVALALSEIFVVSTNGMNVTWPSQVIASWWDMLCRNALGNFRQLLEDVTLHPAMGVYLNIRGSQKENTATGRQPDENYAREVMQLMTIGLVQLNPDGTPKTGTGGATQDTYGQSDVTNLARVFSGYDFDLSQNVNTVEPVQGRTIGNTTFARLPMVLKPSLHSTMDVSFLGTSIPGATEGNTARRMALDTLFNHANTAPFFAKQMIQRLVTSNPSPAYVGRVAAVFASNGQGTRGDIAAVVAAVLLDDEARGPGGLAPGGSFGRLREPMLRMVQWGRSFGLASARGSWKIADQSNPATQLGQSPLRSPSVFNFFRPGYVPPSSALDGTGMVAPEFQLVNESSVSGYLNFMQNTLLNGFYVNGPDVPGAQSTSANGYDITASYQREKEISPDAAALVARINLLMAGGQLSDATVALIVGALNATPVNAASTAAAKLNRVCAAILMVMASAEYLVQK